MRNGSAEDRNRLGLTGRESPESALRNRNKINCNTLLVSANPPHHATRSLYFPLDEINQASACLHNGVGFCIHGQQLLLQ